LVPPPRIHRHRYYGVLAPNSPLRAAVTAMAQEAPSQPVKAPAEPATAGCDVPTQPKPAPPRRSQAHYLWAVLIARIYEVFPLLCPLCGSQMRIIAFITHSADIRQILDHIGVQSEPPNIAPARGPPRWEGFDAQIGKGAQVDSDQLRGRPACIVGSKPIGEHQLHQLVHCVGCNRSIGTGQWLLGAPHPCRTLSHAIELPIRFNFQRFLKLLEFQ